MNLEPRLDKLGLILLSIMIVFFFSCFFVLYIDNLPQSFGKGPIIGTIDFFVVVMIGASSALLFIAHYIDRKSEWQKKHQS